MSIGRFVEQPRAEIQQRHEMYQYAKVRPSNEGPERARWVTQATLTGDQIVREAMCPGTHGHWEKREGRVRGNRGLCMLQG